MPRITSAGRSALRRAVSRFPAAASAFRLVRDDFQFRTRSPDQVWDFPIFGARALAGTNFEANERAAMAELLADAQHLIDVGANVGLYSLMASSMGKGVTAVEPLTENLRYLYRNLALNNASNVDVWPIAAGEEPGIARLFGGSTGASLIDGWAGAPKEMARFVPVQRLDDLAQPRTTAIRTVVKIDVEGFEFDVLRGANALADAATVVWFVEICLTELHPSGRNPNFEATFEYFFDRQYTCRFALRNGRQVTSADVRKWSQEGHWSIPTNNFIFARN